VRLRYTLPALADLEGILDYLAPRSAQGAGRVHSRIKSFIDLLPAHPLLRARTDDPTIRRLVVSPYPYLVFCEVTDAKSSFIASAIPPAIRCQWPVQLGHDVSTDGQSLAARAQHSSEAGGEKISRDTARRTQFVRRQLGRALSKLDRDDVF